MTANNVSSAPTTTAREYDADYDDDESEAARHTEEFFASLMHAAHAEEDGYISPGQGPVNISANMMNDADSLWMLSNPDPPRTSSAPETSAHTDRRPAPHNTTPPGLFWPPWYLAPLESILGICMESILDRGSYI